MPRKSVTGASAYLQKKAEDKLAQRLYANTKDPRATPARTIQFGTGTYKPPVWHVREGAGQVVGT